MARRLSALAPGSVLALVATLAVASPAFARAPDDASGAPAVDAASVDVTRECLDESDRARAFLADKRLVEARAELRLCAASRCGEPVRSLCEERLGEVVARLPTIIFDAKDPEGRDLPSVKLSIDGQVVSEGALGSELTLDPGSHVFRFEVPGEPPVEERYVLVERDKARREHVIVGRPRRAPAADTRPDRAAPAPPSPWRTAGWIALGAGAVGLGIGAAFGVQAIVFEGDAGCDANDVCVDPRARHDARVAADASTIGIVVGGALALGGVALLVFGPKQAPVEVRARGAVGAGTLEAVARW